MCNPGMLLRFRGQRQELLRQADGEKKDRTFEGGETGAPPGFYRCSAHALRSLRQGHQGDIFVAIL